MSFRTTAAGAVTALALAFAALGAAAPAPGGMNLTVGACPRSSFSTIQAAVDSAQPGAKITVCPGTYTEQVTIPAGKDNLTLQSQKPLQAIIQAPAAMTPSKTIVEITGAQNVDLAKFTIEGPGSTNCDSLAYGVKVDGGASATIEGNHITHVRDDPFSGCQNGVAIQVGRQSESTTGTATIKNNTIDDYQKNGLTVDGTGSSATVQGNVITGAGPTSVTAQNGIQVSRGATASVTNNTITGDAYTGEDTSATGILLYQPGTVNISSNKVSASDVGIDDLGAASGTTIMNNETSHGAFDGIDLDTASDTTVQGNNSHDNGGYGYGLFSSTGNTLKNDKAMNNVQDGIAVDSGSTGNTIQGLQAKNNTPYDCEDDSAGTGTAGTGNTWTGDHGTTSSPAGICAR